MKKMNYSKLSLVFACCLLFSLVVRGSFVMAAEPSAPSVAEDVSSKDLGDLVTMAWAVSGEGNYARLDEIVSAILKQYEQEAMALHSGLSAFPARDKVEDYKVLNHVATALFVRAESLMHQGKTEEAVAAFNDLIKQYPYAQSWDPSRGAYWSIAEKSRASVDQMTGVEGGE